MRIYGLNDNLLFFLFMILFIFYGIIIGD